MNNDKAGSEYWSDVWNSSPLPRAINPHLGNAANHYNQMLHRYFQQAFLGLNTNRAKLLEVGAARSQLLPYFAKEFGFAVTGIDYSEVGCRQANKILENEGVQGECILCDFNNPPHELIGAFDIVISMGVVEHFENTSETLRILAQFLKPKGLMFTLIPNLIGLIGLLQKIINRPVYDIHLRLDVEKLKKAHIDAGLEVMECHYFLFTNFGVNNLVGIKPHSLVWWIKALFLYGLRKISLLSWFIENRIGIFKPNRFTSPYIICLARKA